MSKPQLKKATITVLDGADKGKVIGVLFNPTEYSFERGTELGGDRREHEDFFAAELALRF